MRDMYDECFGPDDYDDYEDDIPMDPPWDLEDEFDDDDYVEVEPWDYDNDWDQD